MTVIGETHIVSDSVAKAVLADGAVDPNVILDNGMITFISNPEYSWTIPAIYVASEMLAIAESTLLHSVYLY